MNMLILIMDIKPMVLIMNIELMVILVPSALPVFYHVLCVIKEVILYNHLGLMKWRPYFNDINHSEGSSCVCWIIYCHYISSDIPVHCRHVEKQCRRCCNSLPNNEVWDFLRFFHMTSCGLFLFFIFIYLPKHT